MPFTANEAQAATVRQWWKDISAITSSPWNGVIYLGVIKNNETHRVKSLCDSEYVGTLAGISVENVL